MKISLQVIGLALAIWLVGSNNAVFAQALDPGSKEASIEDFETGDFTLYDWQFGGVSDWSISDATPYEGVYSARSGIITHSQATSISVDWNVYVEDTLSFWYKVSSEQNYDYLSFYIDGSLIDEWSGTIPWTEYITTVPVGSHTFTWEYNKDGSVNSGEDAGWVDYITFPPEEILAGFSTDTTVICEGDIAFFYDLSVGPVTEWNWIFEGATPGTSTQQNPVVAYPTEGAWDVYLQVSDGVETAELYMPGYMNVSVTPSQAPTPTGIAFLCASWGNSTYSITGMGGGVTSYDWSLDPTEAGSISGSGTNITVNWAAGFLGQADLRVGGINYCGVGALSNPLTITRYLPDVNLILPAYIAISTPAFELTGGTPSGGTYSGTGVTNGMFDPSIAGLGEHTITYAYTDPNFCENTATDIITVTEFTDINELASQSELYIYPNPNNGNFSLKFNTEIKNNVNLRIVNSMGKVVHEISNIDTDKSKLLELNLDYLPAGIYYMVVSGDNTSMKRKLMIR